MKKWLICLALSTLITGLGLLYITGFLAQDRCLDSGGRWLGMMSGCHGGNDYNTGYLTSPMVIAILVGIILGISSALVQLHTLLFVGPKSKSQQLK